MVRKDNGISSIDDRDQPICVGSGSPPSRTSTTPSKCANCLCDPYQDLNQVVGGYIQGRCAAMKSDRSQLAAARSGLADPQEHVILEDRLSKEPLAPAVVGGDQPMADATRWVIYALIEAEERGITQANIDATLKRAEADPSQTALRRFLGVDGGLGSKLNLPDVLWCR